MDEWLSAALKSVQKWLDGFLNRIPNPQQERLVDRQGVIYWLETVAYEEGRPSHLRLVYRGRRIGCEGDINIINLGWDLPDRLYLCEICLPPEVRGVGLGGQLLRLVIALAKQQGARSIQGNIVQKDIDGTPWLLDWYQRHGFRVEPPTEEFAVHSIVLDLVF